MAQKQTQKVKGCKKCGRSKRKNKDGVTSLFVRNKITAEQYFKTTNQKARKND
jgi:hypothetical protein